MPRKRHTPEQIIRRLREAEVEFAKGQTTIDVVRKFGITEQTYYRWRKEYGGLRMDQTVPIALYESTNAAAPDLPALPRSSEIWCAASAVTAVAALSLEYGLPAVLEGNSWLATRPDVAPL